VGYAFWVILGIVVSIGGGALVWCEKPLLRYFHPLNLNLLVRLVTFGMITLTAVPLSVFGAWSLAVGTPPVAIGWVAAAAFFEWTVALSCFYYALRVSSISVVMPIIAASPLFTALIAAVFLGERLGAYTIAGLAVSVLGVVILTRWMPSDETEMPASQVGDTLVVAGESPDPSPTRPATDVASGLEPDPDPGTTPELDPAAGHAPDPERRRRNPLFVLVPALLATIAWGAYPIFVEAAERAADGPTVGMMLASQLLGAFFLIPFLTAGRRLSRGWRPPPGSGRRVAWFLLAMGVLELTWGVFFFFLVEELGPVLTSILLTMAPVFAVLGGVVFFRERLNLPAWVGAALALVGVFIASVGGAA